MNLLIDNCHKTMLETRADALALLLIVIQHDTNGKDGPSQAEQRIRLIGKVRSLWIETTEKLGDQAVQEGSLTCSDFGE